MLEQYHKTLRSPARRQKHAPGCCQINLIALWSGLPTGSFNLPVVGHMNAITSRTVPAGRAAVDHTIVTSIDMMKSIAPRTRTAEV